MARVACLGEPLAELRVGGDGALALGVGGDVLNVAVRVRRADPTLDVELHAALGDDPLSDIVAERLSREGVGLVGPRTAGGRVGLYSVRADPGGRRAFRYWRDGSATAVCLRERPGDILDALRGAAAVHLSGITLALLGPKGRSLLGERLERLRSGGTLVVFDPNHRSPLWPDTASAREAVADLVPRVDAVLPSLDDMRTLFQATGAEQGVELLRMMGAHDVTVTDGSAGCVIWSGGEPTRLPPPGVERVVDTTGAGDAFDAGWLVTRLRGGDPLACARAGLAAGAACVSYPGAIPAG